MKEMLKTAITRSGAEYTDAMFHDLHRMSIGYIKGELHNVTNMLTSGGRVSVVDRGGFAASSFTSPEDLTKALDRAHTGSCAMRSFATNAQLAPTPVVHDEVRLTPTVDPRTISFEEKCALLEDYMRLLLGIKGIFSATIGYSEVFDNKTFVNSEGSVISQEEIVCRIGGRIIVKEGTRQEQLGFSYGYDADFSKLRNRHAEVEARAKTALGLLHAESISPGSYTVICDSDLGGVFIHEAFGHLSESDDVVFNPGLHKVVPLGKRMGLPILNVIDCGYLPGAPGTYAYDDEGVKTQKTYLVKEGILTGRLQSRMTSALLGGSPTGNYRAMDYRVIPLVRQSNIFIDRGPHTFPEMLDYVGNGLYLCGGKGGQTMGDVFTFGAQYGYVIANGKLAGMVKDINITGTIFETMNNIVMIGNDLRIGEWGGCGKARAALYDMQMLDKSGLGSPSIVIRDVVIGG